MTHLWAKNCACPRLFLKKNRRCKRLFAGKLMSQPCSSRCLHDGSKFFFLFRLRRFQSGDDWVLLGLERFPSFRWYHLWGWFFFYYQCRWGRHFRRPTDGLRRREYFVDLPAGKFRCNNAHDGRCWSAYQVKQQLLEEPDNRAVGYDMRDCVKGLFLIF